MILSFFSFINLTQESIYSRNNSLPRTHTDLPFTHVDPKPPDANMLQSKAAISELKIPQKPSILRQGWFVTYGLGIKHR